MDAEVDADIVALCLGNPVAELPPTLQAVAARPGMIVADPWAPAALAEIPTNAHVLILGTGLTMADVVVSLRENGHRGPILAVSRRGLLPRLRADMPVEVHGKVATGLSPRATLHAVRRAVRESSEAGQSWHGVLEAVRAQNGALWTAWSVAEQRRFLRHLKPFWDVHRFQMAPQVEAVLASALARQQLSVMRGSLRSVVPEGERLAVTLRPRGSAFGGERVERVDAIVNCTGPSRQALLRNPALASLATQGLVRGDALHLGIDVDPLCRALAINGAPVDGLFVVGPPTRGTVGEVSGAAEVAEQAKAVAAGMMAPAADR
jgi:uncharacterized NAD(P)/FAD-binding protein YdhS